MENRNNGWIKIYRKIKDKGWYQNPKYVHLWIHILFRANHEEKEFMFNGSIHKTKRGEFITGRKALSVETGIAESTIEDILKLFEKEGQIQQQKNNKFRLIRVLNYEKYQECRHPADIQPTSSRHPADTNKNLRIKELKNKEYATATKVASLSQKKKDPNEPMNLTEFVSWCKQSPQRHICIIGEWAETVRPDLQTYGQWKTYIKRHLRAAMDLVPFSQDQLDSGYQKMMGEKDWLKRYTLETLTKFLT